ncbi:MAG TPA: hypothetical protein VF476_13610 [Chitinophagaceae bacterium]
MRSPLFILLMFFLSSCAAAKDRKFTASTPAAEVVRTFLGIPLPDSIDFIRWKLTINDREFSLDCNYGICKPNTNGFINNGKTISFSGKVNRKENYYELMHNGKTLQLLELNDNLFHILGNNKNLLIGNGGWSYTLNNENAVASNKLSAKPKQTVLKDSMAFEGRTPCRGLDDERPECYKRNWYIVFYADAKTKQPAGFYMNGIAYKKNGGSPGTWTIIQNNNGLITYQLNYGKNGKPLYLVKVDENILFFTDADGNLLVGDHDFSYSLNRKW